MTIILTLLSAEKKEARKVGKDRTIIYVKEGEQPKTLTRKSDKIGVLYEAKDWVMKVDVNQQLRFLKAV